MKYSFIAMFDEVAEKSPTRVRNMRYLHPFWMSFPDSEFFILRQTKDISSKPMFHSSINIYNPGEHNLGWAANVGAKHYAEGDYIAFVDGDWINHPLDFKRALKLLETHEAVNPNEIQRRLTEDATQALVGGKPYNWEEHTANTRIACGCPMMFRRDTFYKTGGYLELPCWGILDSAMINICKALLKTAHNKGGRAIHLYHTREQGEARARDVNYKKCYEIYDNLIHKLTLEQIKGDVAFRWKWCGQPK